MKNTPITDSQLAEWERQAAEMANLSELEQSVPLLIAEVRRLRKRQELWECPKCGFEMHQRHYDANLDDEDNCPSCECDSLRTAIAAKDAALDKIMQVPVANEDAEVMFNIAREALGENP